MDLLELGDKAVELRARFDRAAGKAGRQPWTNEQIMQGFVVDVGALMRAVMVKSGAREGPDGDRKLGHELADCLWSVLVLARAYGIDLEKEYQAMIDQVGADLSP